MGGGRRLVDEFEARLADANASCERAQKKYERVAKILVNMKAGTQHVADKLEVIKTDQARVCSEQFLSALLNCTEKQLLRNEFPFCCETRVAGYCRIEFPLRVQH